MTFPTLAELSPADRPRIGGKAANLVALTRAGFPVPDGFVVPVDYYREFVAGTLVENDLRTALEARVQDGLRYAVRSSATKEDLDDASFAGQYETVLGVERGGLLDAVETCWKSVWTRAAIAYREELGIPHEDVEMAVLIQPMVDADVSGVTFTADPVTGNRAQIVTEAVRGLGAALVDGRVSPERFVAARGGTQTGGSEMLAGDLLRSVVEWSLKAEALFERPQDLEWSIAEGKLWILQSRGITSLDVSEPPIRGKWVLFKPVYENFTDPMTPLTAELFSSLAGLGRTYLGRVYYRLALVKAILPFKLTDAQAANAFYLISTEGLTWKNLSALRVALTTLVVATAMLLLGHFRLRQGDLPDDFMHGFRARARKVAGDPRLGPLTVTHRLMFGPNLLAPLGQFPIIVNNNSIGYAATLALLGWLLKRWLPDLDPAANERIYAGNDGVLSVEMGREIWELARLAREVSVVRAAVEAGDVEPLRGVAAAGPFLEAFDAVIAKHGHRAAKEFELATPRWAEDPQPVVAMIQGHLTSDRDPVVEAREKAAEREALRARIREGLSGWRLRLVEDLIEQTRYLSKLRENSRFYHVMVWQAARERALALAGELVAMDRLEKVDDVFYLQEAEIFDALEGKLDREAVAARVRRRRLKNLRDAKRTPPRFLGFEGDHYTHAGSDSRKLRGQGASPGVCEGTARVVLDAAEGGALEEGEILVAPYTDPAWTPLFLRASAAVVEVGSFLSHAGTIAREYGMPCVVDVDDCTRRIRTGDRLRVDGGAGRVELL